jgi:uncharacterized protein YgiM (DUF1202 family)
MRIKKRNGVRAAAFAAALALTMNMSMTAFAYDGSSDSTAADAATRTATSSETERTGTVTTNGSRLNLRDGSGTDHNIIGQLPNGDTVSVVGEENGWYQVVVPEKTGYVSGQYMTVSENDANDSTEFDADTEAADASTEANSAETSSPLTPDGNLELVDDVTQESDGKQFITVQSKNDNTFYIVIDRDKDTDNVYFMNLVDEADLMALMEDGEVTLKCTCKTRCEAGNVDTTCPVCKNNMTECTGEEQEKETEVATEPATDETEKTESKGSAAPIIMLLLIVVLGAGGAVYYMKFKKPKTDTKGPVDLDDYDFGDEDDEDDVEYVSEDDLPEETDDANDNEEE